MSSAGANAGSRRFPDPRGAQRFYFTRADYEPAEGVARLGYRFDNGPELIERIVFPDAPWPEQPSRQTAFRKALELLHGIAGVSYFKAGLAPSLRLTPGVDPVMGEFLTDVYVQGLAEFGYVNALNIAERVHFSAAAVDSARPAPSRTLGLPERALIAMGGGKDSLVGLQMLREARVDLVPACVGESALIYDTVRAAGLPLLSIRRRLAPELAAMNQAGAWNGHVPVTAINSAILLCAAILYGCRYVVFANERSADEATLVTAEGREVNHQYSKSSAFEARFRAIVGARVAPDIEYFSILRPFSELGVVQRFSRLESMHTVFSSCNRNFHLDGPRVAGRWCRDCPKCRFAALSLALFLSPREVGVIQGGDLLDDPGQEEGFRALCRLGRDKPFECVGEAGESRAALYALGGRPEWSTHAVVRALLPELGRVEVPALGTLLEPSNRPFLPSALCARLGIPEPGHAGR